MKLTKLQRYTAYCIMMAEYNSGYYFGICGVAMSLFWVDLDQDFKFSNFKDYFPELYKKRRKGENEKSIYLWNSKRERRLALEQCIHLTHPERKARNKILG